MTDELEAIRQLKARYFRFLDTKDWAQLRGLFTDDAVVDTTASGGSLLEGADAFIAFVQDALGDAITVHQGHMPEITLTAETEAAGVWALHDIVIWSTGVRLDGYGHYHETYRKSAAGWQIASSRLTRLHLDFNVPGGAA